MSNWPASCHSPNSCARNERCMYVRCQHERENIKDAIRYQRHVRGCNRMNDKGEIPRPVSNGDLA